jgi:hypothetical protein
MFVAEFTKDACRSYMPVKSVRKLLEIINEESGRLSRLWNYSS